jgi:hypothetical protein
MNHRYLGFLVLALGNVIVGIGLFHPDPPQFAEAWIGVGSVYLVSGLLLGAFRSLAPLDRLTFRYVGFVAASSMLVSVGIQMWRIQKSATGLTFQELEFLIVWPFYILIPFALAMMLLARAARKKRTSIALIAGILPFVFFLAASRYAATFGFAFGWPFFYYSGLLLIGVVTGLPLFFYTRKLRANSLRAKHFRK